MIYKETFKGSEAVILENENVRIVVIPKIGGKIASFYKKEKDFELIFQNKENQYKKPKLYDDFSCFDAAGFDDAFPTIDACTVNIMGIDMQYPDHGEIWSASFDYTIEDEELILSFTSCILPYKYEKKISIQEYGVKISYKITNTGAFDFPCIWAAHYLVNCHEKMEIAFPKGTFDVVNIQESESLGDVGKVHSYPVTKSVYGEECDLSKVLNANANNTEKYYVNGEVKQGVCSIYYPHKDLTYNLKYEKEILPYLGFWVTEGGFRGDYNCALEPCNGYYDNINIAEKKQKLYYLKKNEILEFSMNISLN